MSAAASRVGGRAAGQVGTARRTAPSAATRGFAGGREGRGAALGRFIPRSSVNPGRVASTSVAAPVPRPTAAAGDRAPAPPALERKDSGNHIKYEIVKGALVQFTTPSGVEVSERTLPPLSRLSRKHCARASLSLALRALSLFRTSERGHARLTRSGTERIAQVPTAVLVHGILGSGRNLRGFARRLARENPAWQFVLVDLR